MGYIYRGIPKNIVLKIINSIQPRCFVETGTYLGDTAIWAAAHFPKVYTIEIMEEFSKKASQRPDCPKNINFCVGNSNTVLPELADKLDSNTVFWLDGHYSGIGTGGSENECPVLDEIKIISACKDAIILIDDARCFFGPMPKPHNATHWPGIVEIFEQIRKYYPTYYSTICDDVIISIPASLKHILDEDWLEHFDERFNNATDIKPATSSGLGRIFGGGNKK